MKNLLFIFFAQFTTYFLVVVNTRAYTNDDYATTILSDLAFASANFFVIKKIAKDDTTIWSFVAYVMGGTFGSVLSMYVSKHWLGV